VFGGPEHLEVTDKEIWLRGTRIDVLWADFFYMAYQCARYQETRFPSKMPDFGQTPAQAAELLANRRFLDHLRTGRVVNISPGRCSSMRAIQASVPPPSRAAKQCAGRGTASRSQRGLQCAATSLVRLLR
jgi:hypothetical protein